MRLCTRFWLFSLKKDWSKSNQRRRPSLVFFTDDRFVTFLVLIESKLKRPAEPKVIRRSVALT